MGRLLKLTDQGASQDVITRTTYGPSGELLTMSGTVNETRGYNGLVQLTSLVSAGVNLQYTYSTTQNNGKIQSQTDVVSGEQITYTYDSLLRLASATSNQAWNQSFSYDGFGNLTDVNGTSPMHTTFNPANNRPNGAVADANGNNTAAGTFDIENRLVTAYGSPTITYSYAPDNKRVWRGVSGSLNEFTLWGVNGQKLATFNVGGSPQSAVGSPSTTNVWFGGRLALKNGSAVSVDNLGSRGKYYPYGGERGGSNPANGQEKFATYTRDAETGLDYADQRYYQPGTGMFLSPDPSVNTNALTLTGNWNRYAYVGGDPINKTDPRGLCSPNDNPPCYSVTGTGSYDFGPSPGIGGPGVSHPISEAYWDAQEAAIQFKRNTRLEAKAKAHLPQAMELARTALSSDTCNNLLKGTGTLDPTEVLNGLNSGPPLFGNTVAFSTDVQALGTATGDLWNPRPGYYGSFSITIQDSDYAGGNLPKNAWNLGSDIDRVTILLHELAHGISLLQPGDVNGFGKPDYADPDQQKTNQQLINDNCISPLIGSL